MNLIIAGVGKIPYLFDCIKAAKTRSGCDVIVVNTEKDVCDESIQCKLSDIPSVPEKVMQFNLLFQVRWIMIQWVIKQFGLTGPFYCPDWDIIILHDVVPHIRAMSGFGMLYTMDNGHCGSAAHVVKNSSVLDCYIDYMISKSETVKEEWELSDMNMWHLFCRHEQIPIANLSEEFLGGVFDHNIHTGGDVWEVDEEGRKKIEWHDFKPYFVRRHDQKRIKAEAIHCWNTYKNKTGELLRHAGLQ